MHERGNRPETGGPDGYELNPVRITWRLGCETSDLPLRNAGVCRPECRPLLFEEAEPTLKSLSRTPLELLRFVVVGQPLADFARWIDGARALGLPIVVEFDGGSVTASELAIVRAAGVPRCAFRLDGAERQAHDLRHGAGAFDQTLQALEQWVAEGQLAEVQSALDRGLAVRLPNAVRWLTTLGVVTWGVRFPLGPDPTDLWLPSGAEVDSMIQDLLAVDAPFDVELLRVPQQLRFQRRGSGQRRSTPIADDGRGALCVTGCGEILPGDGLLQSCGNVRHRELLQVYRYHPTFRSLRDSGALGGRCGECEYRSTCGGSRARAWTLGGRILGGDPLCEYDPRRPQPPAEDEAPMSVQQRKPVE